MKKVLIAIVVLAIIGGGLFVVLKDKDDDKTESADTVATTEVTTKPDDSTSTAPADSEGEANTITYTDSGFSPANLTVTAGTVVTIKNNTTKDVQFASDDHPTHTINSELNLSSLAPSESQAFTPNTQGTFGYHDHINPSQTGTLIVQ